MKNALVVLSGGQDSTVCALYAKQNYDSVHAITFNYGQKHSREIESAKKVAELVGVASHEIVTFPAGILRGTSPLVNADSKLGQYNRLADLPGGIEPTFVPSRNILFLTVASNRAAILEADILTGVCEADFGGYPDCRSAFITVMEEALNEGIYGGESRLRIVTPLMFLTKADTVNLGASFGEEGALALSYSHTCYAGQYPPCGKCHACLIRARGFAEAGVPDPLIMRAIAEGLLPDTYPLSGLVETNG